jgi:hypothetical protein
MISGKSRQVRAGAWRARDFSPGGTMPSRRDMELTIIVVLLVTPVISMVRWWARKNIAVSGSGPAAEASAVVEQVI